MREIKFRAYSYLTGQMVEISEFYISKNHYIIGGYVANMDMYSEPMQYIGLKDINGVEIYEGDIVMADTLGCRGSYVVEYFEKYARFGLLYVNADSFEGQFIDGIEADDLSFGRCMRIEVIGNKFDDAHLIKKGKNV